MSFISLDDMITRETITEYDIKDRLIYIQTVPGEAFVPDINGGTRAFKIVEENGEYVVYSQKKNAAGTDYENDEEVVTTMGEKATIVYVAERPNFNFYDGVFHVHEDIKPTVGVERTVLLAIRDYIINHFSFSAYQTFIQEAPDGTPGLLPKISTNPTLALTAGDGQITVDVTLPVDDGGSPIEKINIWVKPTTDNWLTEPTMVITDFSNLTATITELTNGTQYTVAVTAVNDAGESDINAAGASGNATPVAPAEP